MLDRYDVHKSTFRSRVVGSFTFTPDTITAVPGDEIIFQFWSYGHSVARSEFGFPCMPYEYITPDETGFWSGNMLDVTGSRPTFTVTVNDTKPIFFYCSLSGSCKENKMIGVINPNNTWTLAKQESFINPRVLELRPGDPLPSESNKAEPTQADGEHAHETPSTTIGDIVGIAIGSIAVLLLAGVLAYICRRQNRIQREREQNTTTDKNTLPLINESSPERSDDGIPKSPPPQNYPTLVLAQPTNSGQWSLTSPMTSPCQSSFQLNPPNILSTVPSEASLAYYPYVLAVSFLEIRDIRADKFRLSSREQTRLEVPGSPVPVELPAGDVLHVPKHS
ncbi:hypothetical protein E0Z10_g240 [Xylaria hypoxylon]|uniref:Phytocyanin domain-containing protein n=1 Tax=Xylaria hypoxylon TaxID=37992 RepID=A0A4Z0ZFU3_9PEZI|nr:hypothetical protein E0Z10_g240 [Xylaria hypoxylon]